MILRYDYKVRYYDTLHKEYRTSQWMTKYQAKRLAKKWTENNKRAA